MRFSTFLLSATFLLLFLEKTVAQRTFHAGLLAGLTASQLDGDKSAGFNKPGFQAGGRVVVRAKERLDVSLELQFSQRGAKSQFFADPNFNQFSLTTNYVDVPLQIHYLDWLGKGKDDLNFYKFSFDAGVFYGRFFNYKSKCDDDLCDFINKRLDLARKNDFGFLLGCHIWANRHWGFNVRYNRSFNYLFRKEDHRDAAGQPLVNADSLISYWMALQGVYMF